MIFHSPVNTRREPIVNDVLPMHNEASVSFDLSELNRSTPSMRSRSSFIEQEQVQPVQTSTFQVKSTIDLDDPSPEQVNENTLESKYLSQPQPVVRETISIGSRVIVNTGSYISDKPGFVRFVGEIPTIPEGTWYGIELDEAVGQ